VEWYSPYTT